MNEAYTPTAAETLANLRALVDYDPEAVFAEPEELAAALQCSAAEVEAAVEWLLSDGMEVRA